MSPSREGDYPTRPHPGAPGTSPHSPLGLPQDDGLGRLERLDDPLEDPDRGPPDRKGHLSRVGTAPWPRKPLGREKTRPTPAPRGCRCPLHTRRPPRRLRQLRQPSPPYHPGPPLAAPPRLPLSHLSPSTRCSTSCCASTGPSSCSAWGA